MAKISGRKRRLAIEFDMAIKGKRWKAKSTILPF
jgi:hypothetical protein